MKILNLVWNEPSISYFTEAYFVGTDSSPDVPKMQSIVWERIKLFKWNGKDIESHVQSCTRADEIWKEIEILLSENGYTPLDNVPEISINM